MLSLSSRSRVVLDDSINGADEGRTVPLSSIAEVLSALITASIQINAPVTPIQNVEGTAAQLDYGITPIVDPAENQYAVQLPPAVAGKWCLLYGKTNLANTTFIWPQFDPGTDTINEVTSDPIVMGTGTQVIHLITCAADGAWDANGFLD